MSFTLIRGFRPLSRIAHPSLINSYLLTGSSSVKEIHLPYNFLSHLIGIEIDVTGN